MLSKGVREKINDFIINAVECRLPNIANATALEFGITRQAASAHIRKMVMGGILEKVGNTKSTVYKLKTQKKCSFMFDIGPEANEDYVFSKSIKPVLPADTPKNVIDICWIAFSEIFNNAIEHSEGKKVIVKVGYDVSKIMLSISDDGVGIFNKIKSALNLEDPRFAILELAKGKLTTAPRGHSGEGIFFASRMVDVFLIISDKLTFHGHKNSDFILDAPIQRVGTLVHMVIMRNSNVTPKEIYEEYAAGDKDDYAFSKTIVPLKLMQYEGESLVSRSQARRLIMRFERFKEVILDFEGVKFIGQAFADEVFRVFSVNHPNVTLNTVNVVEDVNKMILHVLANKESSE